MRGKDLLECIEYIDDVLVEEALNPPAVRHTNKNKNKNAAVIRWSMAAACVIVIGVSATALWSHQNAGRERIEDLSAPIVMQSENNAGNDNTASGGAQPAGAVADSSIQLADNADMTGSAEVNRDIDNGAETQQENLMHESDDSSELLDIQKGESKELAEQETAKNYYTVINGYSTTKDRIAAFGTAGDTAPQKGEYLCSDSLQEAMEYYGTQEEASDSPHYAYAVVINMFGEVETENGNAYEALGQTDTGSQLIEQEYRRLIEAGYNVRLSEDFRFTGTFTKEELEGFEVSPEYGYMFGFDDEN